LQELPRAEEQETERRFVPANAAVDRLRRNGAVFVLQKGSYYGDVDLSRWHGDVAALSDLGVLSELLNGYGYPPTFVRLGPKVDASYLPALRAVKTLRVLDLDGANLTDAEIDALLADLPNCHLYEATRRGGRERHPVEASRPSRVM
jgi:hypothetical protein